MKRIIGIIIACLVGGMLQANHWTPVSSGSSGVMTLLAKIQINGVDQNSDQLELGVFCGTECRGSKIAHLLDIPSQNLHYYLVDPLVYGESGETFTFKLYNHEIGEEMDLIAPNPITFTQNGYGTVFDPYVLNFTGGATSYIITATASPRGAGTVQGVGEYDQGQICHLVATANSGYVFMRWMENGEVVSTEASYSFIVNSNRTLVAHFEEYSNHWTPVSSGSSGVMTLLAKIQINGVDQNSDQLELGVFCGTEGRGSKIAHLLDIPSQNLHYYLVDPLVYGESGETFTFRLYNHEMGEEMDLIAPDPITFTQNGYGNVFDPYVLNFTQTFTQTVTLAQGWNWWAPSIQSSKADLQSALQGNLVKIMSDEGELVNGTDALAPGQMYRIQTTSQSDFTLSGIRPASVTVTIENDYNWFGYTSNAPAAIATVFGSAFGPAMGDKVVSQDDGFAIYGSNGWSGTLNSLQPGHGYIYISNSSGTKTVVFE